MQQPYEVLLDIAKLCVGHALDHPDCMELHRRRLTKIQQELDVMYGAVLINKGMASDIET